MLNEMKSRLSADKVSFAGKKLFDTDFISIFSPVDS